MEILEQLNSDPLNKPPNSNVQHEMEDQVELEFLFQGFFFCLLRLMENLEQLDSNPLNRSPNSNVQHEGRTKWSLSFWLVTTELNSHSCVIVAGPFFFILVE
ncbi:hypothetical protein PIB30_059994 [Stylosanthes scabra]|uniref:Uncharacterized protein n=1 Tax=Stylosanthes scabra TaxID=79078 RepID=A0ABU6RKS1_9FABA|nr:hypothetical protein [Stylosanthes scabra]